jgi:hypothetical protein
MVPAMSAKMIAVARPRAIHETTFQPENPEYWNQRIA